MSSHIGHLVDETDDRGIRRSADALSTRGPNSARNDKNRATLKQPMRSAGLGLLVVAAVDNKARGIPRRRICNRPLCNRAVNSSPQPWH